MTRPALVIGLGGTGQWVLTYLKKDLLESNNGQMPDTVRLLVFDSMPQASAQIKGVGGPLEKEVKVGAIRLSPTEFIHLGGDVWDFEEAVQKGNLPHVGSWFQANYWRTNLPRASHILSSGCGQLRQFGRLALMFDLRSPIQSRVWASLNNAIRALGQGLPTGQKLEIVIVGSLAGGTGSGLLIDMAVLARHLSSRVPSLIRGYVVLPHAFDPQPNEDLKTRSFAAWRELNRFMSLSEDFALSALIYNASDKTMQLHQIKNKAFDACYLVDGARGTTPVGANAEATVHPTIADAISALLDDTAGGHYTEYVGTNLAPHYARNPGIALYSAVGTYTYKVPVYYAQQSFAQRLTVSWLDALLKPIRDDPQQPDRVAWVDAASPYDPGRTGRQEALGLLTSPRDHGNQTEQPTSFFGRAANVIGEGGATNLDLVAKYAQGTAGVRRNRGFSWLEDFTNLGDRQDIVETITRVRQEAKLKVMPDATRPGKETQTPPADWPKKVDRDLPPWVRTHYGWRTATGEENRGQFGQALAECQQAQLSIFRRLTCLWLLEALMGGDKRGRLGYAYDLLDGLVANLSEFDTFMAAIKRKREEIKPALEADRERNQRRAQVDDWAHRKILLVFDHPKVHTTQVAYLLAEQDRVYARMDEILHVTVAETVRAMRDYCAAMREEIARWIRALAVGDPATGIEGLYSRLTTQRRQIEETEAVDKQLVVQARLPGVTYPSDQETEELKRLMEGVQWSIADDSLGKFRLELRIQPTGELPAQLERLAGAETADVKQHLTQRNLTALQGYATRRFTQLPLQTRVATVLRDRFATPNALSTDIDDRAHPLYRQNEQIQGGPGKWSELIRMSIGAVDEATRVFIRGQRDTNDKLVQKGLEQERRVAREVPEDARDQDRLVEVVDSADPHKCTVVCTDDVMPVELFKGWSECMEAYIHNKQLPPHLNHNFPADANAAKYELERSRRHRQTYQVFHPWVVMLLEHPTRLEQFLLCWALGWVRPRTDGPESWYELDLPGFSDIPDGRPFRLTPPSATPWSPFQAAKAFVLEGQDRSPASTWQLDYQEIEQVLKKKEQSDGPQAWSAWLRSMTQKPPADAPANNRQVVAWLRDHAEDLRRQLKSNIGGQLPHGEPINFEQAYKDLADVAMLMFEDRIRNIESRLKQIREDQVASQSAVGSVGGATDQPWSNGGWGGQPTAPGGESSGSGQ